MQQLFHVYILNSWIYFSKFPLQAHQDEKVVVLSLHVLKTVGLSTTCDCRYVIGDPAKLPQTDVSYVTTSTVILELCLCGGGASWCILLPLPGLATIRPLNTKSLFAFTLLLHNINWSNVFYFHLISFVWTCYY